MAAVAILEHEPFVLALCAVCGWTAREGTTLCVACQDVREWSRVNRAFCDLLHRTRAAEPRPEPSQIVPAARSVAIAFGE